MIKVPHMPAKDNSSRIIAAAIAVVLFFCCASELRAQSKALQKQAQRYEINAKRMGVDLNSEDALPRSREFLRIDSSYYVGWLFEGSYKFSHAADYLGFKNAAIPLERALNLIERDYPKELATHTADIQVYFPVYNYQLDYSRIAYALVSCYANTEEPEKVMSVLRRTLHWRFQRDLYMDAYNYLSWTTHRNRFYTSSKYSFLRNSIDANESLAMKYLDSGLHNIERNKKYNAPIFQPGYEVQDKMAVYHYKCILYSYAFNIDSADKYFGLMRDNGGLPHNNYANFRSVCGDFREAEKEYKVASGIDNGDKRLQEWAYYTSILNIYKAQPKQGIQLATDMIKGYGSTPGFGWYNIALSRALLYDGQVKESERYADKAAGFKELHIGTTLGQSHYDFSIQLLKLIQKERHFAMQRFEHRNWWYNPAVIGSMAQAGAERFLQQYLIINQFAQNPERDRVIYKLFSTESTVSWDEVWYLMKDFSTSFFVRRFEKELKENRRKPVDKYFRLFIARLKLSQGHYKEAKIMLQEVLKDPNTDPGYELLLTARCYQALAECAVKEKDPAAVQRWTNALYRIYPQLVPFTDLEMPMRLLVSGTDKETENRLRACNIRFSNDASVTARLAFRKKDNKYVAEYSVTDEKGAFIVPQQRFVYKNPEEGGVGLAYRLFGIGGNLPEAAKE